MYKRVFTLLAGVLAGVMLLSACGSDVPDVSSTSGDGSLSLEPSISTMAPVDPIPLVRVQGAPLAMESLRRRGVDPSRATVALRGERADRDMGRAAALLCPKVRRLVVSAPRGGPELALWLRREFGVPILPPEEAGVLMVRVPVAVLLTS